MTWWRFASLLFGAYILADKIRLNLATFRQQASLTKGSSKANMSHDMPVSKHRSAHSLLRISGLTQQCRYRCLCQSLISVSTVKRWVSLLSPFALRVTIKVGEWTGRERNVGTAATKSEAFLAVCRAHHSRLLSIAHFIHLGKDPKN